MKKTIRSFLFLLLTLSLVLAVAACKGMEQKSQDASGEIPSEKERDAFAGSDADLPNDPEPQNEGSSKEPEQEDPGDKQKPEQTQEEKKAEPEVEQSPETDHTENNPYATPTDPEGNDEAIASSGKRVELPFIKLP